jgi:hypothetical protein
MVTLPPDVVQEHTLQEVFEEKRQKPLVLQRQRQELMLKLDPKPWQ